MNYKVDEWGCPPQEIVDKEVKKIWSIMEQSGDLIKLHTLLGQVIKVSKNKQNYKGKLFELHVLRDKMIKIIEKYTPCAKGCSFCCHMNVAISSYEAELIGKTIGKAPIKISIKEMVKKFEHGDVDRLEYVRTPCVFLKEGKCSIYTVRPSVCRTHHNLSPFPNICNVYNPDLRSTPSFDYRIYWEIEGLVQIQAGFAMADIREFFPFVKEGEINEDNKQVD